MRLILVISGLLLVTCTLSARDLKKQGQPALVPIQVEAADAEVNARVLELVAFQGQVLASIELNSNQQVLCILEEKTFRPVRRADDSVVTADIVRPVAGSPHVYVRKGNSRAYLTITEGTAVDLEFPEGLQLGRYGQYFCDAEGSLFWDANTHTLYKRAGNRFEAVGNELLSASSNVSAGRVGPNWLLIESANEVYRCHLLRENGEVVTLTAPGIEKAALASLYRTSLHTYVFAGSGRGNLFVFSDGKLKPLTVGGAAAKDVSWPSVVSDSEALYFSTGDSEGRCWYVPDKGAPEQVMLVDGSPLTGEVRCKSDSQGRGGVVFEANDGDSEDQWLLRGPTATRITRGGSSSFCNLGPSLVSANNAWCIHRDLGSSTVEFLYFTTTGSAEVVKLPDGTPVSTVGKDRNGNAKVRDIALMGDAGATFLSCRDGNEWKVFHLPQ